jgi:hypothetical protein
MNGSWHGWVSLAPAVVVAFYWFIALAVFLVRSAIWGVSHDRELEARGKSILIGNFLKSTSASSCYRCGGCCWPAGSRPTGSP